VPFVGTQSDANRTISSFNGWLRAIIAAEFVASANGLFVCALTVQKAARNKIGMRCWIFINVSIQVHPPALRCG
jgi:hypothetical protein